MEKLVSVIIPTYGGHDSICRAIDSALNQTYPNVEILVVDDNGLGSTAQERTQKLLEPYLNEKRFQYICHAVNKNGAAARNTGFSHSSGDYITLLDDDDCYLPNKIRSQVDALEKAGEDYGMAYCAYDRFRCDGTFYKHETAGESGDLLKTILLHEKSLTSSSLMVRRNVWEQMGGFDESFRRHQDWEFIARVASCFLVVGVNETGMKKYLEFRNAPQDVETIRKYREHYLQKMEPFIARFPEEVQREIYLRNRMDVALKWLKQKNGVAYLHECHRIHAGMRTLTEPINRLLRKSFQSG